MATNYYNAIRAEIHEAARTGDITRIHAIADRYGIEALPLLREELTRDLPIRVLERFESILKTVLAATLRNNVSGETAREIAAFQKSVGPLLKYKSYTIKASSPLGYSIFLQNRGEGFSFQRHVSHKTEVFHIIDVKPGGFVFICDYEEWLEVYEADSFNSWLGGRSDPRYDRFRFDPEPGDVFVIDELGVVHSVIGCVLEEFATVSTDMVDRLHDQNAGKSIPGQFNRLDAYRHLKSITAPAASRLIDIGKARGGATPIVELPIAGGRMVPIARTAITASRYLVESGKSTELVRDEQSASSVYVMQGTGRVILGERSEVKQTSPPALSVQRGDLLMIPAGTYYGFVNEGSDELIVSEHRVPIDVAFVEETPD